VFELLEGFGAVVAVLGAAGFTVGTTATSEFGVSIVAAGGGVVVADVVSVVLVDGCAVALALPAAGDRSSIAIEPPVEVVTRGGGPV
jgi:hypothetical protein